jgi:hypothetical protein
MPSAAENLVKKTTQVKRYSSLIHLVGQKHACKGKTSGYRRPCKHRRHTPPLRSGALHYASFGAHSGRGGLFFPPSVHSVVMRGYFCPLKTPTRHSLRSFIFKRGQPPLSVCARLLVARANRAVTFFAMFRSVFLPALFSGLCRVSFRSFRKLHALHSHRKTFFIPSKSRPASITSFHKFHFILSACRHLPCPQKKTPLHSKKTRQPCVFHVGSRSPRFASHSSSSLGIVQITQAPFVLCPRSFVSSLRYTPGYPAAATLAPLAVGSRLSTAQAKNHSAIAPLIFYLLRSGSRLLYLRCFGYAHSSPRPPTPEN